MGSVGEALTGLIAGLKPRVVEDFTPDQGQRVLDRRNDKISIDDPDEFQPFWKGMAQFYGVPKSMIEGVPGPHSSVPLAKQLGYNDIHKPTPEEMAKFLADIAQMDAHAKEVGPDMSSEDLKTMNDPIGKWLRRDQ